MKHTQKNTWHFLIHSIIWSYTMIRYGPVVGKNHPFVVPLVFRQISKKHINFESPTLRPKQGRKLASSSKMFKVGR